MRSGRLLALLAVVVAAPLALFAAEKSRMLYTLSFDVAGSDIHLRIRDKATGRAVGAPQRLSIEWAENRTMDGDREIVIRARRRHNRAEAFLTVTVGSTVLQRNVITYTPPAESRN